MTAEITLHQSPDTAALLLLRQQLAALRSTLADREAELAHTRARLKVFEARYLRHVGALYAELDELEARIAEREVDLYDSDSARRRARQARQRAQETWQATGAADLPEQLVDPPPSLKTLFRELARRIHPDFASSEAEQKHLTALMMRANQAYSRGDLETLQRLLDDHREIHDSAAPTDDDAAAEQARIQRQLQHAARDLASLDTEQQTLLTSEIGLLSQDAEAAAQENRDLLTELAQALRQQIAEAQYRFDFIDRQISAQR